MFRINCNKDQKMQERGQTSIEQPDVANSADVGNSASFAHEIFDRVCIAQNVKPFTSTKRFRCFRPQTLLKYTPYCDDFGPMDMSSVTRFIELLDQELQDHPACTVMYCVDDGRRALTNAVFLLGAHMVLKLGMPVDAVCGRFEWVSEPMAEGFRDAASSAPDFVLSPADCWRGLARGRELGWVGMPEAVGGPWGRIDMDRYRLLDDPLNAGLNEVVPGELVALAGPRDADGGGEYSDEAGGRRFSAGYAADLLRELGVSAVVRLSEAEYDAATFAARGLAHLDLPFADGAPPPARVVRGFLAAVDAARARGGAVAVHCRAGLGRTGTLAALYMMARHGFAAREAMGWLRIMRPGSVIGRQQRFLCAAERWLAAGGGACGTTGRRAPTRRRSGGRWRRRRPAAAACRPCPRRWTSGTAATAWPHPEPPRPR
jgi:cell division cycle 14